MTEAWTKALTCLALCLALACARPQDDGGGLPPDIGPDEVCECVPYFLCDVASRRIRTDGAGILDERTEVCSGSVDVCCYPPKDSIENEPTGGGGGSQGGGSQGGGSQGGGSQGGGSLGGDGDGDGWIVGPGDGGGTGTGGGSQGGGGGSWGGGDTGTGGGSQGGGGGSWGGGDTGTGGGSQGGGGGSWGGGDTGTGGGSQGGGGGSWGGGDTGTGGGSQGGGGGSWGGGDLGGVDTGTGGGSLGGGDDQWTVDLGGGGGGTQGGGDGTLGGGGSQGGGDGTWGGGGGSQGDTGTGGGSGGASGALVPDRPQGQGCGLKRIPKMTPQLQNDQDFKINGPQGKPTLTGFGEFPWMVALFDTFDGNFNFSCGGSIIQANYILTAAHCVRGKSPAFMTVRAGDWDAKNRNEPIPHQDRKVVKIIMHPDFNHENLFNDIAILVVDRPLQEAVSVDKVCLPEPVETRIDTSNCIATGWGKDSFGYEGRYQTVLRKVGLPIVERDECQKQLRTTRLGKYFKLHESFICAGGLREQDTCTGDGGGPLVCPLKNEPFRYLQMGIVAWGIGCGDEGLPAVYVNVRNFWPWIASEINKLSN